MKKLLNEKVKNHVAQYCKSKGWSTDEATIIEAITEAKRVHREEVCQHRWWNEYLYVVEISGMLIGYIYAEANRDMSVNELGYEFDPSSIREMRGIEKTVVAYEYVEEV
jgi:hypothetical protein